MVNLRKCDPTLRQNPLQDCQHNTMVENWVKMVKQQRPLRLQLNDPDCPNLQAHKLLHYYRHLIHTPNNNHRPVESEVLTYFPVNVGRGVNKVITRNTYTIGPTLTLAK